MLYLAGLFYKHEISANWPSPEGLLKFEEVRYVSQSIAILADGVGKEDESVDDADAQQSKAR